MQISSTSSWHHDLDQQVQVHASSSEGRRRFLRPAAAAGVGRSGGVPRQLRELLESLVELQGTAAEITRRAQLTLQDYSAIRNYVEKTVFGRLSAASSAATSSLINISNNNSSSQVGISGVEDCESVPSSRDPINMSPGEVSAFTELLLPKGTLTYFEWGSGWSTLAAAASARHVWSAENKAEICQLMREEPRWLCYERQGRLTLICTNTGKTDPYGYPTSSGVDMSPYIQAIEQPGLPRFDVIFVDGRFRVATALYALKFVDDRSRVVLRDADREAYAPIFEFYETVSRVGGMVVMKPRTLAREWDQTAFMRFLDDGT
ncbi:unnamed protein product [Vitrella brassicaformis CCMP3155]|uniref:Uncharacterized protein n=2 Tax=Vitrella brassicaformis TaxID=1169539 RepID=A0A0G4EXY4_VITBC|nr:unnamed protein product [Vitrella brassicaformis CCMP3155]|eukprot:CEM03581.1 unnamed protein product [Vitrella brassicaformis CCMP3155]